MQSRRIKVKKTKTDYLMEVVSILSLVLAFGVIAYQWSELPHSLGIHYNAAGQADTFGPKWMLFLMPITGLITWIGMTYLNRFPHKFNYTIKVTESNAQRLYKIGIRTITTLKMLVSLLLSIMTITFATAAINKSTSINLIAILTFVTLIVITPIYSVIKMNRVGK